MRIHTKLPLHQIDYALMRAKTKGHVGNVIEFTALNTHGSRTHDYAYEVQLGSYSSGGLPAGAHDARGKPQKTRRRANGGPAWAATWSEWGWFMAEVFKKDPKALFGSVTDPAYNDDNDFHDKTGGVFR
jgi:hypothetical protein